MSASLKENYDKWSHEYNEERNLDNFGIKGPKYFNFTNLALKDKYYVFLFF